MISLQSYNQVLYHLTQLTSVVNPRSTPVAVNLVKKQNESSISNNTNDLRYTKKVPENSTVSNDFSKVKLNSVDVITFRMKRNNVCIMLDQLYINITKKPLEKSYKWRESYISGSSFNENKQGFPCSQLTEPIILPAIYSSTKQQCRLFHNLHNKIFFSYNKQIRSFKTQRGVKHELEQNQSESRLKKWLKKSVAPDLGKFSKFNTGISEGDITKLKAFLDNANISDEQRKVQVAFAEGYEAGKKHSNTRSPVVKTLIQIFSVFAIIFLLWSVANSTGTVFRLTINRKDAVDPEDIHVTFNDVKGIDECKKELTDVVEFLKNPEKFTVLGGKLPKGVLLVGVPGTGKTLLARAVAGEAGVPFFHASGPEFDEILVGQGARRVRDLFKAAKEKAPCVIFIDEIDSVGGKRTNTVLHPYANQTINQLLSEMDGFHRNEGVIVLGATNRHEDLDPALLRPGRFDIEVHVNPPSFSGRKEILNLYLSKILIKDADVDRLARCTVGWTGAQLETMVNQGALKAAVDGAEYVTMEHLEHAREKILMGPAGKPTEDDEEGRRITAYHEGGHALVAYYTKDADPLYKVTIIPRGKSLGHTAFVPIKDHTHITKSKLLAKLDTAMGGRAAEELIFGSEKVTTGALADIKNATELAEQMVRFHGMSDKVGLRFHIYDPRVAKYGPNTNDLIDIEIKRFLQESYERAKTVLKNHANEHKQLAEALLKYETLDVEDIKAILGDNKAQV